MTLADTKAFYWADRRITAAHEDAYREADLAFISAIQRITNERDATREAADTKQEVDYAAIVELLPED